MVHQDQDLAKVLNCSLKVIEFKLQLHYYVHFWTNAPWGRHEPPYPPSYGLNTISAVLLREWIWH